MMDHDEVDGVILRVRANRIKVSGNVDLMGEPMSFNIAWEKQPRIC